MLKSREELALYRSRIYSAYEAQVQKLIICGGTGCVAGGSLKVYDRLKELMEARNIPVEV